MRYLLAFLLFASAQAQGVVVFSDRAAFQAAAGPVTTIDFENFPLGALCSPSGSLSTPCVLTTQGVTFTSTLPLPEFGQAPLLQISDTTPIAGSKRLNSAGIPVAPEQFFFDFTGSAFGLDLFMSSAAGATISLLADDFAPIDVFGGPTGLFVGVTGLALGTHHVSLYTAQTPSGNFSVDNLAITAARVPEPSTIALLLLSLGLAVFCARQSPM